MDEKVIKYAAIAVGGYLLYTWLRDNGYLAQFGMGPAQQPALITPQGQTQLQLTAPVTPTVNQYPSVFVQPTQPVTPAYQASPQQAPPPQPLAPSNTALKNQILAAAAGDPNFATGTGSAWQWNFYRNYVGATPLTDAQFGAAFPNAAAPITIDQFFAQIQGAMGVGNIVPTQSVPNVPSMSFQGGGGRAAFGSRGKNSGGGYLN